MFFEDKALNLCLLRANITSEEVRTGFPTFSHQAQPDSEPGLGWFYLIELHVVS